MQRPRKHPPLERLASVADRAVAWPILAAIRVYQRFLSGLLGRSCRYRPTCSEYFHAAVKKHGVVVGCFRGTLRICRCHPWSRGGYDPP